MSSTDTLAPLPSSRFVPWLKLIRISAAPTAISNILVGFLLIHAGWSPVVPLIWLIAGSFFLYSAGMVSNDIIDISTDKKNQRHRPLVEGLIGLRQARYVCMVLFLLGIICPLAVGGRALIIALLLAIAILLYNGPLKQTWAGPIAMGSCRSLNILLGASYLPQSVMVESTWLGWPPSVWWISISLGILITGLTYFAKNEATASNRWRLIVGAVIIMVGLTGFATSGLAAFNPPSRAGVFPLLIFLISAPVIIRLGLAIRSCQPRQVQFVVISLLKSLIVYDASFCLLFGQPDFSYALIVLSLLLPCVVLGRWISST